MTNRTSEQTNTAAWLNAKGAKLEIRPAPYPTPAENELVVKNRAIAVNPMDWILQLSNEFGFPWLEYPIVPGSDIAGDVVAVGAGVTRFKPGDRVLAHAIGTDRKRNSAAEGAFQAFTLVLAEMTAPIPDHLSYERAAVLPLGLSTAACGLFEPDQLALHFPSLTPTQQGETLLVWGGSTSVGSNAIQLAVAAGYDVITTASPKNFAYVKKLGAAQAFDYKSPSVVSEIIAALKSKRIAGALAVGPTSAEACVDVVAACEGRKAVAMATYPIDFEGLSGPPGIGFRLGMIRRFAWFSAKMALKTRWNGIRTKFIFGSTLAFNGVGKAIYGDFLPNALARGTYAIAPEPEVIGNSLASIQDGLDMQRKGVSAKKIVISLID